MTSRAIPNAPSDYDERDESPAQTHVGGWLPIDLGPVLRNEGDEVRPTMFARSDGVFLLYPGCIHSLFGESEALKTWLALMAIVQELHLGHHVMFIDYEGSKRSIVARLRALGVSDDLIETKFSYVQPDVDFNVLQQDDVAKFIETAGVPSLVFIDGVTEALAQLALDPNSGVDIATYFAGAPKWFARIGSAVILIDHVTKGTENRGTNPIGSQHKKAAITGASYMVEATAPFGRGKTGRVRVRVAKDREGFVREHSNAGHVIAEVELRSNPDGSITTTIEAPSGFSASPFRPTGFMEQMSKALVAQPGLGTRALRSVCSGNNNTKDLAIETLINEGFVGVTKGSNNSNIHTSLKPFPPINEGDDNAVI